MKVSSPVCSPGICGLLKKYESTQNMCQFRNGYWVCQGKKKGGELLEACTNSKAAVFDSFFFILVHERQPASCHIATLPPPRVLGCICSTITSLLLLLQVSPTLKYLGSEKSCWGSQSLQIRLVLPVRSTTQGFTHQAGHTNLENELNVSHWWWQSWQTTRRKNFSVDSI